MLITVVFKWKRNLGRNFIFNTGCAPKWKCRQIRGLEL